MQRQYLSQTKNAIAPPQPESAIARSSIHPIEELQGAIGNRAVNQLLANQPVLQAKPMFGGLSRELVIQPKLTIGAVGDKYEQEADRISQQVVDRIHTPPSQSVQRQETSEPEDKLMMKSIVQRQSSEAGGNIAPEVETSIQQEKGCGQPLAENIRKPMEREFRTDFSSVKIHSDTQSDRLNQSIQAQAFTTGQDIFFRRGVYQPGSRGGQELIAHELTHVVQQNGGAMQRLSLPTAINDRPALEREADRMGTYARTQSSAPIDSRAALSALVPVTQTSVTSPIVQRRIVIQPADFINGLGIQDLSTLTNDQINEYMRIAIFDELMFVIKLAANDRSNLDNFKKMWRELKEAQAPQTKVELLNKMIPEINNYIDQNYRIYEEDYQADRKSATIPIPNRKTRYATKPEGGYTHTSLSTGKPETDRWGTDEKMWEQFTAEVGKGITEGAYPTFEPAANRVKKEKKHDGERLKPLQQLSWAEAKRVLPRSLINLIFDVRYQLDSPNANKTVIDERTPYQKARHVTTPNEWGTLRSWHQDSHGVLPSSGFDPKQPIPPHATALHAHYKEFSATGTGSSIGKGIDSPIGLAEYTGTGSQIEHNTKIVLDYISKRIYLTLTHYQYWALIDKGGKYEFWNSGTQAIDLALTELDKENRKQKAESAKTTMTLMSPWIEILMPTASSLLKPSTPETTNTKTTTPQTDPNPKNPVKPDPTGGEVSNIPEGKHLQESRIRIVGDCLYDAVNDARGNVNSNVQAYRDLAYDWFLRNFPNYPDLAQVADFDRIVTVLKTPGAWRGDAGDLSPLILASSLGITLVIVTPSAIHTYPPLEGEAQATIAVYYANNHYTAEPVAEYSGKKPQTIVHSIPKNSENIAAPKMTVPQPTTHQPAHSSMEELTTEMPIASSRQDPLAARTLSQSPICWFSIKEIDQFFKLKPAALIVGQTYYQTSDKGITTAYKYKGRMTSIFTLKTHVFERL
jgi:Domain of unknown function (DUF4157)